MQSSACVVRKISHIAFFVLIVLEVVSYKIYLVYALEALTEARLFVSLIEDVKSNVWYGFAQVLPMSVNSPLLIVKDASRFVCLHYETANRHASLLGNSNVPCTSLLVLVCVVDYNTFKFS